MAERSKALRSGRSPLLWAWVRIPLLTNNFFLVLCLLHQKGQPISTEDHTLSQTAEWRSGSVLGP